MASIAPSSAGQYAWVSEFAPRRGQKFLSYIVGWLCLTAWQAGVTSVAFLSGTVIQGLISLNKADYNAKQWHGTLLVIAVASFSILFNTIFAKKLPLAEWVLLAIHILGLFAIIITLWVLSPVADAHTVWFEFTNAGGWSSTGTSTMVGLLTPIAAMLGFDCSVHMSEEIDDASYTLPRSMLWSVAFNAILGFVMAITLSFTLGSVESILGTSYGFPFIQIFLNNTKSYAATNIFTIIVVLTLVASDIAQVATASRQLWSFARDGGIPGHNFVARITLGSNIPLNAVMISLLVTCLLSLINLGSSVALNAILGLAFASIITSYIVVLVCFIIRRLSSEPLPSSRFSLGAWGLPVNVLSLCFLLPIFVFSFFPPATPVDAKSMNWAVVIYSGVMIFATIYYFAYGRKHYVPPVAHVRREIHGRS